MAENPINAKRQSVILAAASNFPKIHDPTHIPHRFPAQPGFLSGSRLHPGKVGANSNPVFARDFVMTEQTRSSPAHASTLADDFARALPSRPNSHPQWVPEAVDAILQSARAA